MRRSRLDEDDQGKEQGEFPSPKRSHPFFEPRTTPNLPRVFTSSVIKDRGSTFIGHYASLHQLNAWDIDIIIEHIRLLPVNNDATHKIVAWKLGSILGSDDDGEKYAGSRLARILQNANLDAVLCVSRWFGGIMLGPIRFNHIENAAKAAMSMRLQGTTSIPTGTKTPTSSTPQTPPRKRNWPPTPTKTLSSPSESGEMTMQKALRILKARDLSIASLRQMLMEKKKTTPSPSKIQSSDAYSKMSIITLQSLITNRDKTINYLRKQLSEFDQDNTQSMPNPQTLKKNVDDQDVR